MDIAVLTYAGVREVVGPIHTLAGWTLGQRRGDPVTACGLTLPRDAVLNPLGLKKHGAYLDCGDCHPLGLRH